jgi:CheY-like chemotaxis protein
LLTAVLGSLELVGDLMEPDPRIARLLDNAVNAARRGATLTRRLLNFSRPRDLAIQSVDVGELLSGMRDLLAQSLVVRADGELPPGHATCALDMSGALVTQGARLARTDPGQLEMALLNLCINARDAMPRGGVISIDLHEDQLAAGNGALEAGRYVVIAVTDQGVGMSPETAARIFEPFFTTKDLGKGTGLGLSMIYGFVRHCGGDVRVRSAQGQGTRMELWLPVAAQQAASGARGTSDLAGVAPASATRRLRVLVVDDEPLVRAVTAGFLTRAGHVAVERDSGAAAIAAVEADVGFDLVVMDMLMPAMGGVECARRLEAIRPGLPVLFVTGFAGTDALPDGAKVLAKPFTPEALLAGIAGIRAAGDAGVAEDAVPRARLG